MKIKMTFEFVT